MGAKSTEILPIENQCYSIDFLACQMNGKDASSSTPLSTIFLHNSCEALFLGSVPYSSSPIILIIATTVLIRLCCSVRWKRLVHSANLDGFQPQSFSPASKHLAILYSLLFCMSICFIRLSFTVLQVTPLMQAFRNHPRTVLVPEMILFFQRFHVILEMHEGLGFLFLFLGQLDGDYFTCPVVEYHQVVCPHFSTFLHLL